MSQIAVLAGKRGHKGYGFNVCPLDDEDMRPVFQAEELIHELCHAATFGFRTFDRATKRVGRRFDALSAKSELRSDVWECKAVAAQEKVFAALNIEFDWDNFYVEVASGCLLFSPSDVLHRVGREKRRVVATKRAQRVLCWLRSNVGR